MADPARVEVVDHPPRGSGLRARQKRRARQELVDAALELFSTGGVHDVTVEDICTRAGVSVRTFYRYFSAKEALLSAPFLELGDRIVAVLETAPPGADAWEALKLAATTGCQEVEAEPRRVLLAGTISAREPGLRSNTAVLLLQREQAMVDTVASHLPVGAPPETAAMLNALVAVALRSAFGTWIEQGGRPSLADLAAARLRALEAGPARLSSDPSTTLVSTG